MKEMNHLECSACGLCCKLFVINLNAKEYLSKSYSTIFEDVEHFLDFDKANIYGANTLKQKEDGSCIYLIDNRCSIHNTRPKACRNFFCQGSEPEYNNMRVLIERARQ